MIVDAEALDQLRTPSADIFDTNSPEPERRPAGTVPHVPPLAMPPTTPRAAEPAMLLGAGSAPPLSVLSGTLLSPSAGESTTSTPRDHQFAKLKWPEPRRMDSTPSLMSQQLSEWSSRAPPRRADAQAPTHRRCRSEGVGFQSLQLTILLPPIPSVGATRSADSTVAMSVPAFYSVQQTIVAALHECRRRLPSAAWRDLEGAELVLRITEDGEPQFDLPALAAKALVVDVGETELALCTKADHGPWHADLSDGEVEELRSMMSQSRNERGAAGGGGQPSPPEAEVEVVGASSGCAIS